MSIERGAISFEGGGAVSLVGAGPTGALLAILLQRRGFRATLYDSRPDPRSHAGESGRSINLAMADRGIHALRVAGVFDAIAPELVAMRGRFIHPLGAPPSMQLYGQRPNEVIYSVSRHRLNQALLEVAAAQGVELEFEYRLEDVDFATGTALLRDARRARIVNVPMHPLLATDGAGSLMRRQMSKLGLIRTHETDLDHGYKELSIPPGANGDYVMPPDALHIWPRGDFMMIALPNRDGSFTATLFLANEREPSFEALTSPGLAKHAEPSFQTLNSAAAIETFLAGQFPDVYALMPDCVAEFQKHPTGFLGTVYADSWHVGGTAALIGDSAHAIVPFHGQGMNCCFEDCIEFDACVARHATWQAAFEEFFGNRKPNTDAIAAMALENYREMRERVIDPRFRLQQLLALELEKRHPDRFIPRYSMVMFHHEIPYHAAMTRGATQAQILSTLTSGVDSLGDVDYELAERLIEARLNPIAHDRA